MKKFMQYIMIIFLIKQLITIQYVNGRQPNSVKTKLFTEKQLKRLAQSVCFDSKLYIKMERNSCVYYYWAPDTNMVTQPSDVRIRYQTNRGIWFQVDPSESWQLVALVPQVTNDSQIDMDINYVILHPKGEYEMINTTPLRNYTIWSTILEEGIPVEWRGGEKAPEYNQYMAPEHREYEIKKTLICDAGSEVYGQFTWNISRDSDVSFGVVNICMKTAIEPIKVWLNRTDEEPQIVFEHLPVNDDCEIEVTGLYGSTQLYYRTPSCNEVYCKTKLLPETPHDIVALMNEDSVDTWKVNVYWSPPRCPPDSYNITLAVNSVLGHDMIHTVVLSGNATTAVFRNVAFDDLNMYYVAIRAILGETTAVITKEVHGSEFRVGPESQQLNIEVRKVFVDTCEVTVNWPQPNRIPDSYIVTLVSPIAGINQTIVLPGDETTVVFNNVTGEGIFNVIMEAKLGNKSKIVTKDAYFSEFDVGPETPPLSIEAIKVSDDTWEVNVNWPRSFRIPDSYIVTLVSPIAGTNQSIVLPGDAKAVVFNNVTGEGIFNVIMEAKLGNKSEIVTQNAYLFEFDVGPEIPPLSIEAIKVSDDTWEVNVNWQRSYRIPDSYIVTLVSRIAGTNQTMVLPGDATAVVFNNVTGEGIFNVIMEVKLGNESGIVTQDAYFSEDQITEPERPDNITINVIKVSANTWKLKVNWLQPLRIPDSYTVTVNNIHKTGFIKLVLPGNATETVFDKVTAENEDLVLVSIQAKKGIKTAKVNKRVYFPDIEKEVGGKRVAVVAGVAGIVVTCVGAAALALLFYCRRLRHRAPVPPCKPSRCSEPEDRWEMRADKLELHEVIGEGAFGIVHRATLAPQSVQVAVKKLKSLATLDEIRAFHLEMELMKNVGVHPHLVSLVGCCSGSKPFIIVEYCSRGDLLSYLRSTWDEMLSAKRNVKHCNDKDSSVFKSDLFKCKAQMDSSKVVVSKFYEHQEICEKELTALDLLSFCRQIAIGMEFLAANKVVHRDLAARNILVTADRTLKISDFGLSRDVYEENQYTQKSNRKMPIKWLALESLTRAIYTSQSDVWSFGVVVFEIVTVGEAPYAAVPVERLPRLLRSGYRMPKPNNCSPQIYDIMLSCWRTHPHERPNFAELHRRFDELLSSACENRYLSLELNAYDSPLTLALEIDVDDAKTTLQKEIDADYAQLTIALEIDADDAQPMIALEIDTDDA